MLQSELVEWLDVIGTFCAASIKSMCLVTFHLHDVCLTPKSMPNTRLRLTLRVYWLGLPCSMSKVGWSTAWHLSASIVCCLLSSTFEMGSIVHATRLLSCHLWVVASTSPIVYVCRGKDSAMSLRLFYLPRTFPVLVGNVAVMLRMCVIMHISVDCCVVRSWDAQICKCPRVAL